MEISEKKIEDFIKKLMDSDEEGLSKEEVTFKHHYQRDSEELKKVIEEGQGLVSQIQVLQNNLRELSAKEESLRGKLSGLVSFIVDLHFSGNEEDTSLKEDDVVPLKQVNEE